MPSFLDLPYELRHEIYILSLIRPSNATIKPLLSPRETSKIKSCNIYVTREVKSELAFGLLSTCRLISAETKIVFYGENIWYLSAYAIAKHQESSTYKLLEPFKSNFQLFRHVTVSFAYGSLRGKHYIPGYNRKGVLKPQVERCNILFVVWAQLIDTLIQMPLHTMRFEMWQCQAGRRSKSLGFALLSDPVLLGAFASELPAQAIAYKRDDYVSNSRLLDESLPRRNPARIDLAKVTITSDGCGAREEDGLLHAMGMYCSNCKQLKSMNEAQRRLYKREMLEVAGEVMCHGLLIPNEAEEFENGHFFDDFGK